MYGVWNTTRKEFQFGISEDTPKKASKALFKKIGYDSYKWRFEIKKIMDGNQQPRRNNMKNLNLESVQEAQEFKKVTPGCYICKITKATDEGAKEYLALEYDIAEGELKGYYKELFDSKSFWGGKFIRSYKEKALPFFKGFITAVENSNSGYKFDNDENKLVGKLIGLVLAEEEYKKNDGTIGTRLYVASTKSVADIKKGGIDIPELKRMAGYSEDKAAFTAIDGGEDELPF